METETHAEYVARMRIRAAATVAANAADEEETKYGDAEDFDFED